MRSKRLLVAAAGLALFAGSVVTADARPTSIVVYDDFDEAGGYTLADYQAKWSNPFGPGEGDLAFQNGRFVADATPFTTSADFSVFDHIKYIAISNQSFPVPTKGSVEISASIDADTPGTIDGRVVHGTFGPPGSYPNGAPFAEPVSRVRQAFVTLNAIDFATGQLFDWLVTDGSASTLIERLPSSVTGSPDHVGRDDMYTQIIADHPITAGPHTYGIRFTRDRNKSTVEYVLDGKVVDKVHDVGIPLDVQHKRFSGTYPSLGAGEDLTTQINRLSIGHGLFSLVDPFPFQHEESPELSVSIPTSERLFGQGARGTFDDFVVQTVDKG